MGYFGFWTIDEGKTLRMGAALLRRVRPKGHAILPLERVIKLPPQIKLVSNDLKVDKRLIFRLYGR